jgi:hypothetical protein
MQMTSPVLTGIIQLSFPPDSRHSSGTVNWRLVWSRNIQISDTLYKLRESCSVHGSDDAREASITTRVILLHLTVTALCFCGLSQYLRCKNIYLLHVENCNTCVSVRLIYYDTVLNAFAKFRKATIRFVMSVCLSVCLSAWNNSTPTGRIFMKFDICLFF